MAVDQPPKRFLTWDEVDALCNEVVRQLREKKFDLVLVISRGGLTPAGIITKRWPHYNVLTACVQYYDKDDERLPHPLLLQFPPEPLLLGKSVLIIDDVWHTGHTLAFVRKLVLRAGGHPEIATLHFKPKLSEVEGEPNYCAETTTDWIVYPWETPAPAEVV